MRARSCRGAGAGQCLGHRPHGRWADLVVDVAVGDGGEALLETAPEFRLMWGWDRGWVLRGDRLRCRVDDRAGPTRTVE